MDDTQVAVNLLKNVGTQLGEQKAADEIEAWGYDWQHALRIARRYRLLAEKVENYLHSSEGN